MAAEWWMWCCEGSGMPRENRVRRLVMGVGKCCRLYLDIDFFFFSRAKTAMAVAASMAVTPPAMTSRVVGSMLFPKAVVDVRLLMRLALANSPVIVEFSFTDSPVALSQ
jgi:hypothetical protein